MPARRDRCRLLMLGERWSRAAPTRSSRCTSRIGGGLVSAGLPGDKIRVVMNAPDGRDSFARTERYYTNGRTRPFHWYATAL